MSKVNRIVVGLDENKKAAVIYRNTENIQERPGVFWRSTLWAADELPVDNRLGNETDRAEGVVAREPAGEGLIFRAVEIPPNPTDKAAHVATLKQLHTQVKQKYEPTEEDLARHPSMHRTDTLDMFVITKGEIYLVTDTDETLLKQGDTAVVQGVNHAWDNRSNEPCMILGVMVSARPWAPGEYR